MTFNPGYVRILMGNPFVMDCSGAFVLDKKTSTALNYKSYAVQHESSGREKLSFNDYMTRNFLGDRSKQVNKIPDLTPAEIQNYSCLNK